MNRAVLRKELARVVAELDLAKDVPELECVLGQTTPLKSQSSALGELLDDLRISVKYLLFDNEASHREIAELDKLLDENE
jgi:hypothetical protein